MFGFMLTILGAVAEMDYDLTGVRRHSAFKKGGKMADNDNVILHGWKLKSAEKIYPT
jgi:hypothetical protein